MSAVAAAETMPTPRGDAPRAEGEGLFGLAELGGLLIALPVDCVREATAAVALSPWPGASGMVAGALDLRGDIIPVLDLHELLGAARREEPPAAILVLRHEGWLVGLLVDAVLGMERPRPGEMPRLAGGPSDLASRSFLVQGRAAAVLDPARLIAMPEAPRSSEIHRRSREHLGFGAGDAYLTFRVDGHHLAVDALQVEATVPRTPVLQTAMSAGWCHGHIEHHGRRVPLLDTPALFDLAYPETSPPATEAVVLRLARGELAALRIDAVCDIRRVPAEDLAPLPRVDGSWAPAELRAILSEPGVAETLVIDMERLATEEEVLSISRGLRSGEAGSSSGDAKGGARGEAREDRRPYLLFEAGGALAAPLDAVAEILRFPARVAKLPGAHAGAIGGFVHRGATLPLYDLAEALGRWPEEDSRRFVLVVGEAGARRGYAISALSSIEPGRWRVDSRGDVAGDARNLVMIGAGRDARLIAGVDFPALMDTAGSMF